MLVSILTITYNHEKYIAQAIESFLMQKTNFSFEIVIGEDCSTDSTASIINEYAIKYPNIVKVRNNMMNIGAIPNFIKTIEECTGKYIAKCEGDDYWTDPNKLQKQVDFLEANDDYAICYHQVKIRNELNNSIVNNYITTSNSNETTIYELSKTNFIVTASVLYRNYPFPEWLKQCQVGDYPLFLHIAKYGKIKMLPEAMAVYRIHGNSIWSKRPQIEKLIKWNDLLNVMINQDFDEIVKSNLKDQKFQIIKELLMLIEDEEKTEEIISDLIHLNTPLSIKYLSKFICDKNRNENILNNRIKKQEEEIKIILRGKRFKIGTFLLYPFLLFKKQMA